MNGNDPIIRTKLRPPLTRRELVPRPQLVEQIALGLHGPLTLITAPAGFGKTTLVASTISQCDLLSAWLSLDKNDNQAGRFLSYLITALQAADQRIGVEAAQLMTGMQQANAEAVLTSLINDLDAVNTEIVLVLDDYQLISSRAVHEAVSFLIEHCPKMFHLVIATRSDPPLPLSRLRARAQTVELRAADLRFNPSEAGQFLNEVMGLQLDPAAVAALEERTEGWIAGLQMAAISMRDRKDVLRFVESFSGTNRYILDYLLEEVLAQQPPETQRFLLYTSILERLTAPLCDAILENGTNPEIEGDSGSTSIRQLDTLERDNLFLVALDDDRTWFRYHHLFSDLLKVRLQQTYPNLVPHLHIQAAAWLERNGLIPEAIQHLVAANEIDQAADLIERFGTGRWLESDLSVVLMAECLPYDQLLNHPKIGIALSWLLINQGLIGKALPLLKDLEQHLISVGGNSRYPWVLTIVRLALAFLGQRSPAIDMGPLPGDQEMDQIPADEVVLRDAADILYGMALARRGEWVHAIEFSEKRMHQQVLSYGNLVFPSLVPFLATMLLFQGRLHAAASLSREYLTPIKLKGIRISSAGNLDVVLGNVLYEWNQLEEAEKHIREGLQANEPWGNIMTNGFGLLALTHVLIAKEDYDVAQTSAEKLIDILERQSTPVEFYEPLRTLKVNVQLARGDLQTAADWVEAVPLTDDYQLHPEVYWLTMARIYLVLGQYADADKILAGIPSPDGAGNQLSRQLEYRLMQAIAMAGTQRLQQGLALIEQCLAMAEPEGYVRVFLNFGKSARDLLAAYSRSDSPKHLLFAHKILNAVAGAGRDSAVDAQPSGMLEPLSERELEVLQLMAQGRTNQDIAEQLIVARGTIKAHAASIYRKLDAANRTEAVARARLLGVLH